MSRTRAHRPRWLKDAQDGALQHDHRTGWCTTHTLAEVRITAYSAAAARHVSAGQCPRRRERIVPCPALTGGYCRYLPVGEADFPTTGRNPGCGQVHVRTYRDTSVPCPVCDSVPAPVTCRRREPLGYVDTCHADGRTPPAWFRNHVTHAPNRRIARDRLRVAAGEYNAGHRAEDDPGIDDAWEPPTARANNADGLWY